MKKTFFLLVLSSIFFALLIYPAKNYKVLGTPGSKGELFFPSQIEEGPDQNIYAFDRKDLFIKVYSSEGAFLYKTGGKGEGPGEFKRFARFGFTKDGKELFTTEYFTGHNWITFFSLKGKFLRTVKFPFKGFYGAVRAVDTGKDVFIVRITYSGKVLKKGKIFYYGNRDVLYGLNKKSGKYFEIKKSINYDRISNISNGGDIGIPFIPRFDWGQLQDGRIVFSNGLSNSFELLKKDGVKESSLKMPIPMPEKITSKDLDIWRKEIKEYFSERDPGWYKTFGSVAEKYRDSIYKFKPCHSGFSITPSGKILIRVNIDPEGKKSFLYLVNISGRLIIKVFLKNISIYIFRHIMIARHTDEDDEEEIRIYRRKGSEKSDLKLFLKQTNRNVR